MLGGLFRFFSIHSSRTADPPTNNSEQFPLSRGFEIVLRPVSIWFTSFGFSLLFLLFGPYSNYAPAGFLDTWIYTGYFTHFSYLLRHYGITYYVSRLPYIVPGLLIFRLASPATASVVLNTVIMAAAVAALYFIVYWHYGRIPAALACIALMTNPYFVSGVAWDYPDGPAVAYAFLALAAFLRPTRGRIPNGVIGGACLALSAYTNFAGLPSLLGILMVPIWGSRKSLKGLFRQGIQIILGTLGVTLSFAMIGKLLIGTYLFFMPQINMIRYTRAHPDYLANMWGTDYAWIPTAYRLFPAVFMVFLGGVILLHRRRQSLAIVSSYLCLIITCVLFAIFEFGFHNVGLRVFYCSTYIVAPLLVFAGLVIGETLTDCGAGELLERAWKPHSWMASVIWMGVALFGLGLPFWYRYAKPMLSATRVWTGLLVLGILTATCLSALSRRRVWPCALGTSLIFAGLFLGPALDPSLGYVWGTANVSVFQSLMRIEHVVDSNVDPVRRVRFWFDRDEPEWSVSPEYSVKLPDLLDSAYSLYLWGYFDFTNQLSSAPVAEVKRLIDTKTTFVHLTLDANKIPVRTKLLISRGILTGNDRYRAIPASRDKLWIILQDVLDQSEIH